MNQTPEPLAEDEIDGQFHACVNSFPLCLPSILQQQIIQEIESRLSVCDKIEEMITASLK